MKTVAIRADGGKSIGMGHIMRCMSLAKEFINAGVNVYFISRYMDGIYLLRKEGFTVFELKNDNSDESNGDYYSESYYESELKEIMKIVENTQIEVLVIDTYNVTLSYLITLKNRVRTIVYIDDINKFVYPVNVLINGNITAKYMNYKKFNSKELLLLGLEYNLIRSEFKNLPFRTISKTVSSIMITTGGSDPFCLTEKILKILLEDSELGMLQMNVIVGNSFNNKEALKAISKNYGNVILYENIKCISEVMLNSDIAISAGGSTLYELCACGTPILAFIMAHNQEMIVKTFEGLGYLVNLGWHDLISEEILISGVKQLIMDFDYREKLSLSTRVLVDGLGSERAVIAIMNIAEGQ